MFVRLYGFVTLFEATNITSQMINLANFPPERLAPSAYQCCFAERRESGVNLRQYFLNVKTVLGKCYVCATRHPLSSLQGVCDSWKKVFRVFWALAEVGPQKGKALIFLSYVCQLLLVNRGCFWVSRSSKFKTNPLELQFPFFFFNPLRVDSVTSCVKE